MFQFLQLDNILSGCPIIQTFKKINSNFKQNTLIKSTKKEWYIQKQNNHKILTMLCILGHFPILFFLLTIRLCGIFSIIPLASKSTSLHILAITFLWASFSCCFLSNQTFWASFLKEASILQSKIVWHVSWNLYTVIN